MFSSAPLEMSSNKLFDFATLDGGIQFFAVVAIASHLHSRPAGKASGAR
jgi:hypothetical protein